MRMALRPSTNARPRPATQGGDLEGGVGELRSDCGPGGDPSGEGGCPRWVFAVHARRAVGIPQLWAGHRVSEGHIGISGRKRGCLGPGCCQRLRRVGRRRFGTFGEPACSAAEGESRWRPSFPGGVGAPWIPGNALRQQPQPDPVPSRRTAGEGVKLVSVYGKRRLSGNRSPESALAILQKSPPAAVWTHDQTHAITSI